MWTRSPNQVSRRMLLLLLLTALRTIPAAPAAVRDPEEAAMEAAVVPSANLILDIDLAALADTPIQQKADQLKGDAGNGIRPPALFEARERMTGIRNALGISAKDVAGIRISLSTEGMELGQGMDLAGVRGVAAARLNKALTLDGIADALGRAEGMGGGMTRSAHGGVELLRFETGQVDPRGNPVKACLALVAGGRVIYIALEDALKGALDRLAGRQGAAPGPELAAARKSVPRDAQVFLVFSPDAGLRGTIRKRATEIQATDPMMANTLVVLSAMKRLTFTMRAATALDLALAMHFGTPDEALQVKTMLDMMVLGMGKMTLMQIVGKPIPMIESLKSEQKDTAAVVSMRLTEADFTALSEIGRNAAAPLPPAALPAPVPAAPGGGAGQ